MQCLRAEHDRTTIRRRLRRAWGGRWVRRRCTFHPPLRRFSALQHHRPLRPCFPPRGPPAPGRSRPRRAWVAALPARRVPPALPPPPILSGGLSFATATAATPSTFPRRKNQGRVAWSHDVDKDAGDVPVEDCECEHVAPLCHDPKYRRYVAFAVANDRCHRKAPQRNACFRTLARAVREARIRRRPPQTPRWGA